jgi:hypothetical protein
LEPIIDPCGQQPSSALAAGIDLSVGTPAVLLTDTPRTLPVGGSQPSG